MTKLTKDKKYIYRVYDFTGGLMRYIIIIILLCSLSSCSSIGKGNLTGSSKDFNWELDGNQCAEVEFYPDGKIKSAKIDNKAEPLININNIPIKYENND